MNCRRGKRRQIRKGEYIMNPVLEKIQKTVCQEFVWFLFSIPSQETTYISVCVCICVYMYIYTHKHMYIHIHMYIQTDRHTHALSTSPKGLFPAFFTVKVIFFPQWKALEHVSLSCMSNLNINSK